MGILRPYGVSLNVPEYQANSDSIVIDEILQKKIMTDKKATELNVLRDTKNASKSALLAEYVTVIPPAFKRIIEKLAREVK